MDDDATTLVLYLDIECRGAAFDRPTEEVVRLLRKAADRLVAEGDLTAGEFPLVDSQGNRCGLVEWRDEEIGG